MAARIIYGVRPVEEALHRGRAIEALVVDRRGGRQPVVERAGKRGVPVSRVATEELDRLCGGASHQGIAAVAGEYPYRQLHELVPPGGPSPLLVVADSVMDPQNLGTMFRAGLVLGATGVVIPKDRAVQVTPTVVRVSAGATELLPCARVTNLARALDELKELGLWVVATVEAGGIHPAELDLGGPLALVVGNEHRGLRPLIRKRCDLLCTLPSAGTLASLNVGVATAVLVYEAARQRRPHSTYCSS